MSRILFILLALQFATLACSQQKEKKEQTQETPTAPNEYPPITLKLSDGKDVAARDLNGNNVFILFQPDCDHCQHEAIQIEQRLEEFKDYSLYFISSAPMENIVAFGRNFKLYGQAKVKFAWTSTESVLTYYGSIPTPSIYIYSNGRLKQSFNGQTNIDNILRAL